MRPFANLIQPYLWWLRIAVGASSSRIAALRSITEHGLDSRRSNSAAKRQRGPPSDRNRRHPHCSEAKCRGAAGRRKKMSKNSIRRIETRLRREPWAPTSQMAWDGVPRATAWHCNRVLAGALRPTPVPLATSRDWRHHPKALPGSRARGRYLHPNFRSVPPSPIG